MVSPEKYMKESITNSGDIGTSIRSLVIISKILQAIGTGVEFDGSKETYMQMMNPFVRKKHLEILPFYRKLLVFFFFF